MMVRLHTKTVVWAMRSVVLLTLLMCTVAACFGQAQPTPAGQQAGTAGSGQAQTQPAAKELALQNEVIDEIDAGVVFPLSHTSSVIETRFGTGFDLT